MTLKCLIVDDEPIARQIIAQYCGHLKLDIVASCEDALIAHDILKSQHVDIVFLDINMPVLDGIAFAKIIRTNVQIVFTTAYKEFAHDAFDLNACDYLLKPFSLDRFIQAIDKVKEKLTRPPRPDDDTATFTYIKTDGKIFKIDFDDVLYAEASGNNVKIVMLTHQLLPTITFSSFEEILPKSRFIRVHRSFIINRSRIRTVEGNRIMIDNYEIPIGANYRATFLKEIGMG